MKLYIFTPNRKALFNDELEQKLSNEFEVVFYTEPKALKEHSDFINDADEKIVALDPDYFGWSVTKEDIDLMQNVKALCLQTTSFSWIDTAYAKEKNIPVLNLLGFSAEAVAEYALTLALGVARKLSLVAQDQYKQDFVKHQSIELKGKTAGVIGLGRIGTNIATLAKGIGMNVVYWSKSSKDEKFEYLDLESLMSSADVIFVALAQNEETKSILTDELLKSLKKSAMFISVVHKIYNHDLIVEMVQTGDLYGYGYEEDNGSPLSLEGNIYCLPALAWATKESMEANAQMWVDSISSAGRGEYLNRIN